MVDQKFLDQHVAVDLAVQHGKPYIRGTRTPVYVILEALAMGLSSEEVRKEFAPLTAEDIRACILYASLLANEEELTSLGFTCFSHS